MANHPLYNISILLVVLYLIARPYLNSTKVSKRTKLVQGSRSQPIVNTPVSSEPVPQHHPADPVLSWTRLIQSYPELHAPLTDIQKIRASILKQRVTISQDYIQTVANRTAIMREIQALLQRQKKRAAETGVGPRSYRQDFYRVGQPLPSSHEEQQERQKYYQQVHSDYRQEDHLKELLTYELSQQTINANAAISLMQELDTFYDTLSQRFYSILKEPEIEP